MFWTLSMSIASRLVSTMIPSTVQPTTPVPIIAKCPPFLIEKSRKTMFVAFLSAIALFAPAAVPDAVRVETSPGSFPERTLVTTPLALRKPPSINPGPEIMTLETPMP